MLNLQCVWHVCYELELSCCAEFSTFSKDARTIYFGLNPFWQHFESICSVQPFSVHDVLKLLEIAIGDMQKDCFWLFLFNFVVVAEDTLGYWKNLFCKVHSCTLTTLCIFDSTLLRVSFVVKYPIWVRPRCFHSFLCLDWLCKTK